MGSYLDAADAGLAVAETKLRSAQGVKVRLTLVSIKPAIYVSCRCHIVYQCTIGFEGVNKAYFPRIGTNIANRLLVQS